MSSAGPSRILRSRFRQPDFYEYVILLMFTVNLTINSLIVSAIFPHYDPNNLSAIWRIPMNSRPSPIVEISSNGSRIGNPVVIFFKYHPGIANPRSYVPKVTFQSDVATIVFNSSNTRLSPTSHIQIFSASYLIPITGEFAVSVETESMQLFTFYVTISDISQIPENQTSIRFFGKNYYHRYAEANRICYNRQLKRFAFFTDLFIKFNSTILAPGSRPLPLDYPSCRMVFRLQPSNYQYSSFNASERVTSRSFLTCRWYSMHQFWHALFDYTLPLWWTTRLFGGVSRKDRVFFIDENSSQKGTQFLCSFFDANATNVVLGQNSTCWDHAIVGFPKSEFNVNPNRWASALDMPYEYPKEAFDGFREHMVKYYCGEEVLAKCHANLKRPHIVVAMRSSPKRHITNSEDIVDEVMKICPNCDVSQVYFENMTISHQLSLMCNASLIISIHGAALSHMIWMEGWNEKAPVGVVEILPYRYNCRNWYRQIASGSGVRYFSWENPYLNNSFYWKSGDRKYQECIEGKYPCLSEECHDVLRDQNTYVDIQSFRNTLRNALSVVRGNKS